MAKSSPRRWGLCHGVALAVKLVLAFPAPGCYLCYNICCCYAKSFVLRPLHGTKCTACYVLHVTYCMLSTAYYYMHSICMLHTVHDYRYSICMLPHARYCSQLSATACTIDIALHAQKAKPRKCSCLFDWAADSCN